MRHAMIPDPPRASHWPAGGLVALALLALALVYLFAPGCPVTP